MAFEAPSNKITGQLTVGNPTGFNGDSTGTPVQVSGSTNNYFQVYCQNTSNGDTAATDFIAGADNDITGIAGHYIDTGIAGSGFSGVTASLGIIKTVSVTAGGTGYTVGDVLTLATGDVNAQVTVLVAGGGVVSSVQITDNGSNYTVGTKSTTGGTGTGCTINVLTLVDLSSITANDGYVVTAGGNTIIATDDTVAGKVVKVVTGGLATANERLRIDATGAYVMPQLAIPAGGTTATGLRFSSTANLGIFFGSGAPTLSAAQGSLYIRTNGTTTNDRMYVNTNGTNGWTSVTTAT